MNTKKRKIIDAAMKLFIDKGFALTSIQDIISGAQISKGTFYNYFASKNECLMAILDYVQQEGDEKRRQLAFGKDIHDETVLVKQIAIRMDMNREHNLIAIFETVTFSNDEELIAYIRQQHIDEVQWLSKRLEEIYPFNMKKFAMDQAVIFIGMIHHCMHVWKLGTDQEIDLERVIQFAFNRLKPILKDQMDKDEAFFPENWLTIEKEPDITHLKENIISRLVKLTEGFYDNQAKLEYLQFISREIQSDNPRIYIVETVLRQLNETVKESTFEQAVRSLTRDIWNYLEVIN